MPRLLSGRVGVTSYSGLSTDRQQFLDLSQAEANLGIPVSNNYALFGNVDGTRYWGPINPSGSVDGITVQDEGVTPVGFGGSITIVNLVGTAVSVFSTKQIIGSVEVGVATIRIDQNLAGVGIGSFVDNVAAYDVEYLNPEIGLTGDFSIDSSNMPNATKAWTSYEQFNINSGVTFTIGEGKVFIVDILNLASV
jgi:hypothetical protein